MLVAVENVIEKMNPRCHQTVRIDRNLSPLLEKLPHSEDDEPSDECPENLPV
jgi:hypothetical protein